MPSRSIRLAGIAALAASLACLGSTTASGASGASAALSDSVHLTTVLKSLDQKVTFPVGSFAGSYNIDSGSMQGAMALPPATTTVRLAGVGLATATLSVVDARKTSGTITFGSPDELTATSTVWVKVDSLTAGLLPVNLVGDRCATKVPVVLELDGAIVPFGPSVFSGTYVLPSLSHCGALTAALNAVLPGSGNTFTVSLTPF